MFLFWNINILIYYYTGSLNKNPYFKKFFHRLKRGGGIINFQNYWEILYKFIFLKSKIFP